MASVCIDLETSSLSFLKREVTPVVPPELLSEKVGFMKVRLSFSTMEPTHIRSFILSYSYNLKPPYQEDVSILFPCNKTYTLLETFIPAFEHLQKVGVVPKSARLLDFRILDEDNTTLAYIFP